MNVRTTDALRQAFELAYFIHRDRTAALEIAIAAVASLEVAATAQTKRLYYRPGASGFGRSKVLLDDLPLLQRLVYIESERLERPGENGEEGDCSISADDLTVRFVKHLVQITVKRNAFHVTVGISRILHNYSTAETIRIQDDLVSDPQQLKTEDYYRSRKALLMDEISCRFGPLLRIVRSARGEERFEAVKPSSRSGGLVSECLRRFTPWETRCLPHEADGLTGSSESPGDSDGYRNEVTRMHAVLHPDCFRRLMAGLRLEDPANRLEIPHWRSARHLGSPDDRNAPGLLPDDLAAAGARLDAEAARRRRSAGGVLHILVDGRERAQLDPVYMKSLHIRVETTAEILEVYRPDVPHRVRLATHLLSAETAAVQRRFAIILEAGQEISFSVERGWDEAEEARGYHVEIRYREPRWRVRWGQWLPQSLPTPTWLPTWRLAFGFALLLVVMGTLVVRLRPQLPDQRRSALRPTATAPLTATLGATNPPRQPLLAESVRRANELNATRAEPDTRTRGFHLVRPAIRLKDVTKLHIECRDPRLREELAASLLATNRFAVTANEADADAELRIGDNAVTRPTAPRRTALLVGPAGQTLWRESLSNRKGTRGFADAVAQALLHAVTKPGIQ
jgi:hypothetical protein